MTKLTASTSPARRSASGSGGDTNCGSTSPHEATKRAADTSAATSGSGSRRRNQENLGAVSFVREWCTSVPVYGQAAASKGYSRGIEAGGRGVGRRKAAGTHQLCSPSWRSCSSVSGPAPGTGEGATDEPRLAGRLPGCCCCWPGESGGAGCCWPLLPSPAPLAHAAPPAAAAVRIRRVRADTGSAASAAVLLGPGPAASAGGSGCWARGLARALRAAACSTAAPPGRCVAPRCGSRDSCRALGNPTSDCMGARGRAAARLAEGPFFDLAQRAREGLLQGVARPRHS